MSGETIADGQAGGVGEGVGEPLGRSATLPPITGPIGFATPMAGPGDGPPPGPDGERIPDGERPGSGGGGGKLTKLLGKAGWNLADQMLSSLTNMALVVLAAKVINNEDRAGAFAVALTIAFIMFGVERALVAQVLGVRHSALTRDEMRVVAGNGLGTVAVLGGVVGLGSVLAGVLIGGIVGPSLIAVGVVMPWVLMQDTCRYVYFAQSLPKLATANDAIWTVLQFSALGVLAATGTASPWALVLAWGGAAAVAAGVAFVQLRTVPRLGATLAWCRAHSDLVGYMLPETLLSTGGLNAMNLLTGKIVGVAGVAALSFSGRLLGPLGMVSSALMSFSMPELSRRKDMPVRSKWIAAVGISGVMTVISLGYLGVLLLVPDSLGASVFGPSWHGIRSVLLPAGLFSTAAGACLGPAMVVISMGQAKRSFTVTLMEFPLVLTLMPLGANLSGAPGAAWGQFVAQLAQVPVWFWTLRSVLRSGDAAQPSAHDIGPRHMT